MKTKAYLDTTVLADSLIKIGTDAESAKAAIAAYQETQLPVYAIKEFKSGPLGYVSYLHRKLLDSKSYPATLYALARVVKQQNRVATCLRLLGDLRNKVTTSPVNARLIKTYGNLAEADREIYDSLVIECKVLVSKAWLRCNFLTTKVVDDLDCYKRVKPRVRKDGTYDLSPTTCETTECSMAEHLKTRKLELTKLVSTIKTLPPKRENGPRQKVLHSLAVRGNYKLLPKDCRALGDAVFVLYCPPDADILTTNVSDHKPLADALRKTVLTPTDVPTS